MSQEFVFEFSGTKEDFLNKLGYFPNNDRQFYYFDNYIVRLIGDEIHFGVERAGHSNGHWFIPTITEHDGKIEFRGSIQYIGSNNNSTPNEVKKSYLKKCVEKTIRFLLYLLLLPFVIIVLLLVKAYELFKWLEEKMLRQPTTKAKTKEDKLIDLMENYLDCVRK